LCRKDEVLTDDSIKLGSFGETMSKGKRERAKVRMPFGRLERWRLGSFAPFFVFVIFLPSSRFVKILLRLGSFVQLALSPQQLAVSRFGNWLCLGLFFAQRPAAGFQQPAIGKRVRAFC
jgi:hypothetical protein